MLYMRSHCPLHSSPQLASPSWARQCHGSRVNWPAPHVAGVKLGGPIAWYKFVACNCKLPTGNSNCYNLSHAYDRAVIVSHTTSTSRRATIRTEFNWVGRTTVLGGPRNLYLPVCGSEDLLLGVATYKSIGKSCTLPVCCTVTF